MIKISPINFNNIYKSNNISRVAFKSAPDSFERTTQDVNSNEFISWAQETDFLKSGLLETISNSDNKLGKGFNNTTYSIPNNDEYILRKRNLSLPITEIGEVKIRDTEDKNLDVNIGQGVALITIMPKGGLPIPTFIEVMKKQKGSSIGIPPAEAIYDEYGNLRAGEEPYESAKRKEKFAKDIHDLAQLPVSSFENLIDTLQKAAKAGYNIDHKNSNNILLDRENGSINIIDTDKMGMDVNYGNVLFALTNAAYMSTYCQNTGYGSVSEEQKNQAIQDSISIIDKYTQAMKNKGVKFDKETCSYEFAEFLRSLPCSLFLNTFDKEIKWQELESRNLA